MMPAESFADNKARAAVLILTAIGLASTQDAIVKAMSGTYPVHETMLIRGLTSLPILGAWLAYTHGLQALFTPLCHVFLCGHSSCVRPISPSFYRSPRCRWQTRLQSTSPCRF